MLRRALALMLVLHTIASFIALKDSSVLAVFPPFRERFVYQVFSDLVTATGIVFLLCVTQLKRKGRSLRGAWLMLFGAALVGSFSPLVYLLVERDLFDGA